MRKYLVVLLVFFVGILAGCEKVDNSNIKLGIARLAHDTSAFIVTTVIMKGDTIDKVVIDEYQYLSGDGVKCVPNGDTTFKSGTNCLASKRENNDVYSANMKSKGGATQDLLTSYEAIEKFAEGKTLNDLVTFMEGKSDTDYVDAISGCTLQSTKDYVESIVDAVKNAE